MNLMGHIAGICIFLIFAESIIHFTAGEQYQKYVKLLVNIMVLSQFIIPIKAFITGEEMLGIDLQIEQLQKKIEESAAVFENNNALSNMEDNDLGIYESVKEEMKTRLNHIEETREYQVTRVEFVTYEGSGKEVNESIQGIVVYVNKKTAVESAKQVINVEVPIVQLDRQLDETSGNNEENAQVQELNRLRELFCSCLGTQERYMEVKWDG